MVQSVSRALEILELLKKKPRGLGVTEIAHQLEVAKSTAHRLLMSLEEFGYVQKSIKDSIYCLGLKFIEMNGIVVENLNVVNIARPLLEQLGKDTGEIVHLVMLDGNEIVYIDKVDNDSSFRIYSQIGRRAPLYCTGVGKCILANLTEKEIDKLLSNTTLTKLTQHTLTEVKDLKKEFQTIRKNSFSYDNEEHELGIRCIAAPIFDHTGKVQYAISITGPASLMTDEKLSQYIPDLKETAAEISRRLGYYM